MSWMDMFDWVEIPAGTVHMGTPAADVSGLFRSLRLSGVAVEESWFVKECPRHTVEVEAFTISRHPVTVEQFARVTGLPVRQDEKSAHPMAVPHAVAAAFAERLAQESGQAVTLPGEVQWERAARGDDAREYPWGEDFSPEYANIGAGSRGTTTPVGAYPLGASPFGLLDMAGNLDEWTATAYAPYPNAPEEVPQTESWACDVHVTRGGGWNHGRDAARCARRHGLYDGGPIGFRLAVLR